MNSKTLTKILTIIFVVLLSTTSLLLSVAYITSEEIKENYFVMGEVKSNIVETFDGKIKKDVYIENIGNVPIYVRADILIYFIDEDGIIQPEIPTEGIDYEISLGSSWKKIGDKYYYQNIIDDNNKSTNLINRCENLTDKKLVVEILTQSIQANVDDALQEAWNITNISG